jgi:ferredoxin
MNEIVERKITGLTVKIERPTCIASENCINFAPDLFQLDDEGICAFTELKDGMEKDKIIEACSVCPVNALFVIDEEGTQLVP